MANHQPPSWREIGLVALGLAMLAAAQITLADAAYLFHAHFWLDELFTFAIVSEPNLGHALEGLTNAVDTNPPTLHLLLRSWTGLWGGPGELAFRSFALLSMFLALLGIYLVLRELFAPLPALAGMLAVWCHPLILRHAFEARFYGPWLAGLVWYVYSLAHALRSPRHLGWLSASAATAIFVCTIHYFGIITLILVTAFELWPHRPWGLRHLPCLAAASLGPIALLACTPFFLGQRAALTVGTWIAPPELAGIVVGLLPLLAVFCLLYLRRFFARQLPAGSDPSAVLGLVALALLPAMMILFSLTVQPATMARYILPALAALAPMAAFVSQFLPRRLLIVWCVLLAAGSTWGLHDLANLYRERDRKTKELIVAIRALPADTPVVFEFTNSLYVVERYAADLTPRVYFLDFDRDQLKHASNHRIITRDVARQVHNFKGKPDLMNWAQFRTLPHRYVVPGEELLEPVHDAERRFPGFMLQKRAAGLVELVFHGKKDARQHHRSGAIDLGHGGVHVGRRRGVRHDDQGHQFPLMPIEGLVLYHRRDTDLMLGEHAGHLGEHAMTIDNGKP